MPVRPIRSLPFCVPFMQQFHRSGRVDGKRPSHLKTIIQAVLEKLPSSPPPPTPPPPKLINCLPPTIIRGKLDEQRAVDTCCLYTRCLYKAGLALSRVCWTRLYLLPYGHRGDTNCSVFLIGIQRTPFHQCQAFT